MAIIRLYIAWERSWVQYATTNQKQKKNRKPSTKKNKKQKKNPLHTVLHLQQLPSLQTTEVGAARRYSREIIGDLFTYRFLGTLKVFYHASSNATFRFAMIQCYALHYFMQYCRAGEWNKDTLFPSLTRLLTSGLPTCFYSRNLNYKDDIRR